MTKEECMSKELSPRKREVVNVPIPSRHQLRYTQALKDLAEAFTSSRTNCGGENDDILSSFQRLRQISAIAKVDAIVSGKLEDVDANSNTSCVWQFRLANTNDAKLLDAHKEEHGVRVHRILKNGVYFSTRELEQLGTKKKDLMAEYEEKQRDIVNKC